MIKPSSLLRCTYALGITLLVSGCSTSQPEQDYQPEVTIPDSWQSLSVTEQVQLDPWWERFNDPELNTLIEQVLISNNDLALATLTLRSARLKAGLTEAEGSFQISLSTDASRETSLNSSDSSSSYSTDLSISYELDLWGRVASEVDAAKWTSFANAEDRESTAQSLAATTASLYWEIGYLKQSLALSQDNIDSAKQSLAIIESQYRSGAVTQLDIFESQRSLAEQQVSYSESQQELVEAQNALTILYNQPPMKMPITIDKLPEGNIPMIAAGVPADLLIRRPDVKSALYSLKSAYATKDATFAGYLPSLTLSGAIGSSSDQLKDLLSNPIGTLGANLMLPFLQWNEMELNKKLSQIDVESAIVTYRDTLYGAFSEVDNAISARQQYQYQGARLQEQYNAAEAAERIYASQYRYGAIGIQDWLDAQDTLRDTEQDILENRYNQFNIQAVLYQALGGSDIAPEVTISGQKPT
ncbi:efflux transporter outer membrane subunit [Psychromonas sp. GE-S-Ul-11]|uniref:efflux transporter outer membrane subunit n=1 Tax=Psychromonas sp. GE-S-Ul-11 TaxID=3241170 RepID=UPI00390C83F0